MKRNMKNILITSTLCAAVASPVTVFADEKAKEVKVGIVTFLSGGAAGPFGIPSRNAAEVMIEAINKGKLPGEYSSKGLAGATISPIYVDEASKQKVADYKKLVQKDKVQAVIGYVSSGSCKAIAPIAEEEKTLTIFSICGTSQVFEDVVTAPKYVFRTMNHTLVDNLGAAKYVVDTTSDMKSMSGINQNYAFGQDSWRDFSASVKVLKSDVTTSTEQFPKIFAGQYGSEISALLTKKSDVVHSSFWGGDLEAFIIQAGGRGLFSKSKVVLSVGDTAIQRLGSKIPDGTIIGARGPYGLFAQESELNTWFRKAYFDRFSSYPDGPSYQMAQAILAMKVAADKSGSSNQDDIRESLKGLEFQSLGGKVSMSLSDGHQATTSISYGTYKFDKGTGKGTLVDIKRYNAECVNPPVGVKSSDWIKSGFKDAVCK